MNELEICRHLDLRFDEFLQKIECSELKSALIQKAYFAGGCIYCLFNDKPVKDYDIFLRDDSCIEHLKKLAIWSYVSEYALTCGKFQVVIKYFGEPEDCVGQFDFKHNMHYYVPNSQKIQCAYEDELLDESPFDDCMDDYRDDYSHFDDFKYLRTNELFFNENRARDIEGVMLRVKKFTDRGMTISKETKKKIKKRTTPKKVKQYKKSRRGGRSYY